MSAGTVLVVDDSDVMRAVLCAALQDQGHEVVQASTGEEALTRLSDTYVDVVLLDVLLPGIDGFEVLARLQQDDLLQRIPVVFLTNLATSDEVVRGLSLGAHDYLRKPFEPAELQARVSAAVRVKRLQDELQELSRTDPLTRLPNRREMNEIMQRHLSTANRHGQVVAAVLGDLDRFKTVNDTLGHEAGDAVLVEVSARLRDGLRAGDVVGRWGGEEFLAILPMTDSAEAVIVAERLRLALEAEPVRLASGEVISVTGSFGLATGWTSVRELLADADAALYQAKAQGRNRVCIEAQPAPAG